MRKRWRRSRNGRGCRKSATPPAWPQFGKPAGSAGLPPWRTPSRSRNGSTIKSCDGLHRETVVVCGPPVELLRATLLRGAPLVD